MSRHTPLIDALKAGAALAALLICMHNAAAASATPSGPGSLSGVWASGGGWQPADAPPRTNNTLSSMRISERDRVQKSSSGEWPPLQPWASELLEKRIKQSQAGAPEALTLTQCLPSIPAFLFGGPYPVQILETPGQVTMLFEEQNHFRTIYLNGKLPDDPDPTYMGHSVGHWEGDTLIVDTIGLMDNTPIDRVGIPHSENLHLIERWHRVDASTVEMVVTMDDPKAYTKKWDVKKSYKLVPPGTHLTEYICENNRDY